MPHSLASLQLSAMTDVCSRLRRQGEGADCLERVADRVVRLLREEFVDDQGRPAARLARMYLTMRLADLDEELRHFARVAAGGAPLDDETRCLTLLATAGDEEAWNSRRESAGHQAIPLPDVDAVARVPMVSQLLTQLGLDVAAVVDREGSVILEAEQRTYNVFHVPKALGSPAIPAQDGFVRPYGIESVVGFGGTLPTGQVFAVLLFSRVKISRDVADMFRNAAMNLKLALLPLCRKRVFERHAP